MTNQLIEIIPKFDVFTLTWVVNNICTNQCSYCPSILHAGTNHHYSWEHAEKFARFLIDKYPKIHLALSGGEPTLSPFLMNLVAMFSDAGHAVGMTTNGARTVRYYEEISQHMTYIVFSHHPSFADPQLVDKALAACDRSIVTVSIMFDSRYFDQCLNLYNDLRFKHPKISVMPVKLQDWTGPRNALGREYTEAQLDILNSLTRATATQRVVPKNPTLTGARALYSNGEQKLLHAQELINNNQTHFLGWDCRIGLECLFVQFDGIIKTANCRSAAVIGRIQEFDSIQWPTESFICPQTTLCHCVTDVQISKKKL